MRLLAALVSKFPIVSCKACCQELWLQNDRFHCHKVTLLSKLFMSMNHGHLGSCINDFDFVTQEGRIATLLTVFLTNSTTSFEGLLSNLWFIEAEHIEKLLPH